MKRLWILSIVAAALLLALVARSPLPAGQGSLEGIPDDEQISVASFEEMGYPVWGLLDGVQGDVVVKVKLDDHGKVVLATDICGSRALTNDALANAKKWQFRPNTAKTAVIIYEFRFAEGTCGATLNQLFVFREPNIASVTACPSHSQPTSN